MQLPNALRFAGGCTGGAGEQHERHAIRVLLRDVMRNYANTSFR